MILIERTKDPILEVIDNSEKFIKLVSFQFSDSEIIEKLLNKAKLGLKVEILTLPIDSINDEDRRKEMRKYYNELEKNGVLLYKNIWEVGDPTLTDTSESGDISEGGGEKWYSLHGKFIFSEKEALIMSANIVENIELDVFLKYENKEIIFNFEQKFNWLYENFIDLQENDIKGNLINKLPDEQKREIIKNYKVSDRLLIKNYPEELVPNNIDIKRGLIITPFDIKARLLLEQIIDGSKEFLYLMSERLYDEDVVEGLIKKAVNNNIDIKLITGRPERVRQNPQKARSYFKRLGSVNVNIGTLEDVHGKVWMNENFLIVGSANVGKMNLGFRKNGQWRSNTEILMLENNKEIIRKIKTRYEEIFETTDKLITVLGVSNKAKNTAKQYFDLFDYYSKKEAKTTFGKIKMKFEIDNENELIQIAKYSAQLAKKYNSRYITKQYVVMSTVLTILRRRSSTMKEILELLSDIIKDEEIQKSLDKLIKDKFINKSDNEYELNIEALIS